MTLMLLSSALGASAETVLNVTSNLDYQVRGICPFNPQFPNNPCTYRAALKEAVKHEDGKVRILLPAGVTIKLVIQPLSEMIVAGSHTVDVAIEGNEHVFGLPRMRRA